MQHEKIRKDKGMIITQRALLRMVLAAILCITVIAGLCGFKASESPSVAGTWGADMTRVLKNMYNKYGIDVKNARTTAIMRRDGTYTSQDYYILIAARGPRKGERAIYKGFSKGTYTFKNGRGTIHELSGTRTVNGKPVRYHASPKISIELKGKSTLLVVEDYGKQGKVKYALQRQ